MRPSTKYDKFKEAEKFQLFSNSYTLQGEDFYSLTSVVGGRGLPILVMPLGIVTKIPCQRIFVLSDLNVLWTFVVDNNPRQKSWHTFPLLRYPSRNLSVFSLPSKSMLFKLPFLVYDIVGGGGGGRGVGGCLL